MHFVVQYNAQRIIGWEQADFGLDGLHGRYCAELGFKILAITMKHPTHPATPPSQSRFLTLLLIGVTVAMGYVLRPFYGAILWAGVIALIFAPLNRKLLRTMSGRPTAASVITLLVALVMVVLPAVLVITALALEASSLYHLLQSNESSTAGTLQGAWNALPEWVKDVLGYFDMTDVSTVQNKLLRLVNQTQQLIETQAWGIGQNAFQYVVSAVIAAYLAFFLIRDGERIAAQALGAIPLGQAQKQELIGKFSNVIRATVKGSLLVASVQGALGGLAFVVLGVKGALLWAVMMGFLSLLPAVGAAIVWFPVACFFLLNGETAKFIALATYGMLVIGLIDNLLRPALVGKATRLPDYLVMITTLGGIAVFGINGVVLGPVIAAMFIAVWHIYATRHQ